VVRVRKGGGITALRLALAACLVAPVLVQAAGLGRLTVQSDLGQPLRAQVEIVSLQPGEEDSLSARIASIEAFRQAGIEYSPSLASIRVSIERRDGKPIVRLSSSDPLNEPFVELLVELQWATGRLVREYTFLLDPPGYKGPQPIAAPAPPPAPAPVAKPSPIEPARPAPLEARPLVSERKAAAGSYEVKKGDTLGKIARENRPAGVTLNQMLIALYRANQEAFIRGNINLVRAGRILTLPDREAVDAVESADANRMVQTHTADFAEYRRMLAERVAAGPATTAPGEREVTGRIAAKPEAPAPSEPRDQLKLSKADPAKPSAPAARAAREDDRIAIGRALQEAQSRITDLEKNVADLQKLLELKNQQLAQLEQKAAAKPVPPPAPKPDATTPEPPKPVAEAPKPDAPKPAVEAPKPKPAAEAPKPKPAPVKPLAPEPSLMDEFLENPFALAGLGGVVVLLGGYGAWAWRRKKKTAESAFRDAVLGAPGALAPAVAAGAAVAQAAVAAPAAKAALAPEAEEVDPIAEADVYMAYGRDAQAEEILKEALGKDANRVAVHVKLLEIYANRRDPKAFEQTALKVKNLTGGAGADWDKAAALGRSIDPQNGLYGGGEVAAAGAAPAAAPAAGAALAPALDFDISGTAGEATAASTPSVSLDLDISAPAPAGAPAERTDFAPSGTLIIESQEAKAASGGLDFDLGGAPEKKEEAAGGIDFDLGGTQPSSPGLAAAPVAAPAGGSGGIDFDLNLDLGGAKTEAVPAMDLSSVSLDLGEAGAAAPAAGGDARWQEVATKLDLAKAYEEMGDKDGARELLNEVVKDGDAAQQEQAKKMLAGLG
jgi:pilus assembly protein FimV